MLAILRAQFPGTEMVVICASNARPTRAEARRLQEEIEKHRGPVLAELGGGDRATFLALRRLARDRTVVVTVHDPGVVVGDLVRLRWLDRGPWPLPILGWQAARLLRRTVSDRLIRRMLARTAARVVLHPGMNQVLGLPASYLPQPVYTPTLRARAVPATPKIGYLGFWSPLKGTEDLLQAFRTLLPRFPEARFVLAGGGTSAGDAYAQDFAGRARRLSPRIELPGFVPSHELDAFIRGLSALVLPYHPALPGAASAMLMRGQEAAVPLIIADGGMLRGQVDPANVTLVPPGDPDALAAAIAEHLSSPEVHEERARREQARIYQEHNHQAVGSRLKSLLEAAGMVQ
jgi:glycosyltransferase involved in cell wall biosynthesis